MEAVKNGNGPELDTTGKQRLLSNTDEDPPEATNCFRLEPEIATELKALLVQ